MSKHTPGPWHLEEREYAGVMWDAIVRNHENDPVASVGMAGYTKATGQANARLIAAAPEMLEALKATVVNVDTLRFTLPSIDRVLAAIAKAEGA